VALATGRQRVLARLQPIVLDMRHAEMVMDVPG
jgi:hypothetical protein